MRAIQSGRGFGLIAFFLLAAMAVPALPVVVENFDTPPDPADWELSGGLTWYEVGDGREVLLLTDGDPGDASQFINSLFWSELISADKFSVSFDFWIGQPTGEAGGEGMTFAWVREGSSLLGDGDSSLGFYGGGVDGYAVEFDTCPQPGRNHVAIVSSTAHSPDSNGFVAKEVPKEMENAIDTQLSPQLFHVDIVFDNGHLEMWMSNENAVPPMPETKLLDDDIPGYVPYDAYFGFTAAMSSSNYSVHAIDNVVINLTGAHAGKDQVVWSGDEVTLDGSRSLGATAYHWHQVAGEPTVTLDDPTPDNGICHFTAPDLTVGTLLTFQLDIQSANGPSSATVNVSIRAKNAPAIAPQNIRALRRHLGFRLTWDPLIDADEYGVGIKFGPDQYLWFMNPDTYYDLLNLTEGEATTIAVRAKNSYGEGVVSEDMTLLPMRNLALAAGTTPPSEYVYVTSQQTIADMNNGQIEDDSNDSDDGLFKEEDYWGYLWPDPVYFDHVTYHTGDMSSQGGWFTDLTVQCTQDGTTWVDVPTTIYPEYDFTDELGSRSGQARFDLYIPTLRGTGIRIYGAPGGPATFTSIAELEVFADNATARPLVVQGLDADVPERSTATLDGSFTFSTRGDITSAMWEQVSGPAVTIDLTADPMVATFAAPGVDDDTLLVFKLTAGDGTETLSDEDVRITVKNLVTTAVAGPDQRIVEGSEATVDGSGSLSTTGNLTYLWTQTGGTPVGVTGSTDVVVPFTAPVLWAPTEELTFQLDVNDGAGGVSTDEVVIKVRNSLTASVFDVLPVSDPVAWQFQGSANYDDTAGILEITPAANDMTGSAFLTETIDCTQFQASFKLYIGDGSGADGMVFGWVRGPSFMGGGGGSLGWYGGGLRGYGIVFDTYPNPAVNLVSFENPEVHTGGDTGGYVSYTPPIDMEDAGWFDVEVEMDNGHLQVWMTNEAQGLARTLAIDYTLEGYTGFDAYFGFTGATGGANNNHWVDDLPTVLSDAYAVRELPISYEPGGTVHVGLSMRVNADNKPSTVTISEPIPAGLTVVDAGGGTQVGGSINWSFSGGGVATQKISYTLGVPGDFTGALDFTGTISFAGTTDDLKGDKVVYEVPSAPQNLDVEMLLSAYLSWSASPEEGVVGYRVFRSVNGQEWEEVALVSGTSYTDISTEPGSTYNYRVQAVNAIGAEGPFSDPSGEKMIVMEIREAEDFDYGGGQWPGDRECPAAIEAPTSDDTGPQYDFFYANDIPVADYRRTYRPSDNVGMHGYPTDDPNAIGLEPTVIGWISVGDWWKYTFDVPAPGSGDPEGGWVKIQVNVSADGTLELYWDEVLVGTVNYSTGGDYHTYGLFPMEEQFQTTPGEHTLRVKLASGGLNFNKIGVGFNWSAPTREDLFADDFEDYTTLYSFADLVAAGYTVNNGSGVADGAWRLWNTGGDSLGNEDPDIAAMTSNYVITDSDLAGAVDADEEFITPNIDCTSHRKVRLDFNMNYRPYPDDTAHLQIAEVDVRSSEDGVTWGDWVTLRRWDRTTVADTASGREQVDVSAYADGKIIQVRWHSYEANFDYWFAVDDLRVSGDRAAQPPPPKPIIRIEGDNVTLSWEPFGDGNYTVDYTDDLVGGSWEPVPGFTWPIQDTNWLGEDITGVGGRFYRVNSQ